MFTIQETPISNDGSNIRFNISLDGDQYVVVNSNFNRDVLNFICEVAEDIDEDNGLRGSVSASTTGALPAVTYFNGPLNDGVGGTLTEVGNGALPAQDGIALLVGDRVLVKDQVDQKQNGIYTVTSLGSGGTPFVLTRATDFDNVNNMKSGALVPVISGTTLGGTIWMLISPNPVNVGVSNIIFKQAGGGGGGSGGVYGYFYNKAVSATVAIGAPFPFDTDGPTTPGFLHTASPVVATSAPITIVNAGTYYVEFTVTVAEAREIALYLNGAVVLSTIYGQATGTAVTTGMAVIAANAGDVLTLRNHLSVAALTLVTPSGGTANNNTNSLYITAITGGGGGGGGGGLAPANFIFNEAPVGVIDGVNTVFTLASVPTPGKQSVFVDGVKQDPNGGSDYTIVGAVITFAVAPMLGSVVLADYLIP